jgi:hypothetical protein
VRDAHTDRDTSLPAVVLNTINGDEIESYESWESVTNSFSSYELSRDEQLTAVNAKDEKKNLRGVEKSECFVCFVR